MISYWECSTSNTRAQSVVVSTLKCHLLINMFQFFMDIIFIPNVNKNKLIQYIWYFQGVKIQVCMPKTQILGIWVWGALWIVNQVQDTSLYHCTIFLTRKYMLVPPTLRHPQGRGLRSLPCSVCRCNLGDWSRCCRERYHVPPFCSLFLWQHLI